jgi:predicted metal-dependent hydrolase
MAATPPPIEVRDARFPIGPDVPKHWNAGRRSVSIFFDNLSVFFPVGERFFIHAVRAHKKHVEGDPELVAAVAAFCAQEGMHGREHTRYNEALRAHGYPIDELEGAVDRLLVLVKKRLPRRKQLAATAALEHFTALLANAVLSDPRLLEGADPTMASLWRWHAAEEAEHKAVAFDVYRAAKGPYAERAAIMLLASAIFWAKIAEHQVKMMRADGIASSPREWAKLFEFLFVSPGAMRKLVPGYLDYFRPGFHPWQRDDRELLERWKRDEAPATRATRAQTPHVARIEVPTSTGSATG